MADQKYWKTLACMTTPSPGTACIWMGQDGEERFTSTRQLMKYLRTTFTNCEFKVMSYNSHGGKAIEVKYRCADGWWD